MGPTTPATDAQIGPYPVTMTPPDHPASERGPLTIVIAADTFAPDVNGGARFTERLAAGLAERGHHVHVATPSVGHRNHGVFTEEIEGQKLTVHRLPGWRTGGTHYTYANAVVLNDLVLIPEYTAYPVQNGLARTTYEAAFPGRAIVPIDADAIVGLAGVFHCIVMHVPDPDWLFADDFETEDTSVWSFTAP